MLRFLCRNAIQAVQATLNSTQNPGLNGALAFGGFTIYLMNGSSAADELGEGSTQSSQPGEIHLDQPFWDALNEYVKNLRAVISGHGGCIFLICLEWLCSRGAFSSSASTERWILLDHGNEWCALEPTKDVIFCFDKHSG